MIYIWNAKRQTLSLSSISHTWNPLANHEASRPFHQTAVAVATYCVCTECLAHRCRLEVDLLLRHEVALVPDEELVDVLVRVPVNLVQPRLHVREAVLVSHVVHDDDAMRTAVVRARDGPEALLARRVPLARVGGGK